MIRVSIALRLMVAVVLFLPSASGAQVGFDRHGGDYANFPVRSGDPAICAARCDRDARCRAWSFNYPAADRAAVCRLTRGLPRGGEAAPAAAGFRAPGVSGPPQGGGDFPIDPPGGDYAGREAAPGARGETGRGAGPAKTNARPCTSAPPAY